MQLIYEGRDITSEIEIRKADLIDNAGTVLDSLELHLNDPKGLWNQWKPEKNHTMQIKDYGIDSGVMYIDEIGQHRGAVILRGLPVKQEAKTENTKAWDSIRFMELAQEIASKYNLQLETYGTDNFLYTRVDQIDLSDFQFLSWRCLLEGYALKVSGGKLIIFSQEYMEKQAVAKTITINDIDGDFIFKNKSIQVYGACRISYQDFKYEFKAPVFGPTLKYTKLPVSSMAEAERFSKGLLRAKNCYEQTFGCTVKLDAEIAAGNTINVAEAGLADGKYFAYQINHEIINKKKVIKLRKPLEGY